jgi:hypothetical protein
VCVCVLQIIETEPFEAGSLTRAELHHVARVSSAMQPELAAEYMKVRGILGSCLRSAYMMLFW